MSAYRFNYIIKNIDILLSENSYQDKNLISLQGWADYGIVGWDEKYSCYYVSLVMDDDEYQAILENDQSISLENSTGIHTFEQLCNKISDIFGVWSGIFEFENNIEITKRSNRHTEALKSQPPTDYLKIISEFSTKIYKLCKFILKWAFLILTHIFIFFFEAYINSQWKKSKNRNYYNPFIGVTIYRWGDDWNMVINDVHYKHYSSVQSAKDDALEKWWES